MKKKNLTTIAILLTVVCMAFNSIARADDKKEDDTPRGTSAEELAKLKERPLPQPHDLKVAILPLWDTSGSKENTRMATSAVWLIWQKEGFTLTPILDSFKAVDDDGEIEPGLPLRKEDAVRIGQKLGMDWVVYGEIRDLQQYHQQSIWRNSKYVRASLRLAIVEITHEKSTNGNIIYWQMRNERRGGTGIFHGQTKSGDTLKRKACITVSNDILKPLFHSFPAHKTSDKELDSGDIADFVNQTWPQKKDQKDK